MRDSPPEPRCESRKKDFSRSLYFPIFLQEINGDAFKHLKILVELNLSHNNITHIEKGTFRGNDRLQTLNLAGNQVGATNDFTREIPPKGLHKL